MTTYRLPIEIEHALPNWFLVDFRKESLSLAETRKRNTIPFSQGRVLLSFWAGFPND
jgi:hypothetical protein